MKQLTEGLTKFPIYLLAFLLPLFVLPFNFESYEFNKIYLLLFLTIISLIGWLAKAIFIDRALIFRRSPLDIAIAFLFVGGLVSTIFSQDFYTSLFGFYGRFSGGFIELLLWILVYLVITNNFSYFEARRLFIPLFASAGVLALIFFLSLFGWLDYIPLLSMKIATAQASTQRLIVITPLGLSPQLLAVFEALALVFLVLYGSLYLKTRWLALYIVSFLLLLACLTVINYSVTWLIIIVSLGTFLLLVVRRKVLHGADLNRLSVVVFSVLFAALLFLFPGISSSFKTQEFPLLTHQTSWIIARSVLASTFSGSPAGIVGTGLGNFTGAYSSFHPTAFNRAPEWSRRFDVGSSYYLTLLATTGIVGLLCFLAFVAMAIYLVLPLLKKAGEFRREASFYGFGLVALLVSLALYYQPIGLALIFWLTLAPLALLLGHAFGFREYRYEVSESPETTLFLTSLFFVGLFLVGILLYFAGQFYYADVAYALGIRSNNLDQRITSFTQAVSLNPYRIPYRIDLARSALSKVGEEIRKQGPSNIKDISPLAVLVQAAGQQADSLITLAPRSVISWENRGSIYSDIRTLLSTSQERAQAATLAIDSYKRAMELERANPVLPMQIAALYLDENDLAHAQDFITKAKDLKPDYANTLLTESLLLEKQGKIKDALAKLDSLAAQSNLDPLIQQDALFHLGRIAYNAGQFDRAISALKKVIELNPGHSNAHYALGLSYEQVRDFTRAKAEYRKVLELNPNNAQVQAKLKAL